MNKFAAVNLHAPQRTQKTRRPSSVVGRPQNHLRTARNARRATYFWAHRGAQKPRQLASRLTEVWR